MSPILPSPHKKNAKHRFIISNIFTRLSVPFFVFNEAAGKKDMSVVLIVQFSTVLRNLSYVFMIISLISDTDTIRLIRRKCHFPPPPFLNKKLTLLQQQFTAFIAAVFVLKAVRSYKIFLELSVLSILLFNTVISFRICLFSSMSDFDIHRDSP